MIIETQIISFNNEASKALSFSSSFSNIPKIVATPVGDIANVNIFISGLTKTSATISSSQVFSGDIHIHIISS